MAITIGVYARCDCDRCGTELEETDTDYEYEPGDRIGDYEFLNDEHYISHDIEAVAEAMRENYSVLCSRCYESIEAEIRLNNPEYWEDEDEDDEDLESRLTSRFNPTKNAHEVTITKLIVRRQ